MPACARCPPVTRAQSNDFNEVIMPRTPLLLCLMLSLTPVQSLSAAQTPDPRFEQLAERIAALEADSARLREQAAAAQAQAAAAMAELQQLRADQQDARMAAVAAPAAPQAAAGANGNAFNPAISLILNGVYAHHSMDPQDYVRAGFPLVGEGGPGEQGLKLGESEVSMSANIDDKFYGQLTLAFGSADGGTEVGIEEAFIDTLALPDGLSLRAGRFYSNIGYLNSHHTHTDNFVDRPLAYQAFLGNQYGDDGVQLRWVAPTDTYVEVGAELFRGDNYPTGGAQNDGIGAWTLFAHAGGDVGIENSWLAGISVLQADTGMAEDGFSGDQTLYVADATWKWAPRGNTKDGGITVRGEYFFDDRDGIYVDATDPTLDQTWRGQRRGAYLEGIYRINRIWDAGYRYDRLWADAQGPVASSHDPVRNSLMLTWRNSEFSLFRLQYSRDQAQADSNDNAIYLQYQTSLGAHGAHKF
jgi:hypothetical protein